MDYIGDLYEKNVTTGVETKRYALGGTLVATNAGGTLSYLRGDYLHSTVSASNGASVEYTPYGLVRSSQGTLPTDRQFQGQQNQAGIGLYRMGARWYDPTIGIWTQPDTVVPNPLDPTTLNRYSFVEGNPLRLRDPSGHSAQEPSCDVSTVCNGGVTSERLPPGNPNSLGQPPEGQRGCDPSLPCLTNTIASDEYVAWLIQNWKQSADVGGTWTIVTGIFAANSDGSDDTTIQQVPKSGSAESGQEASGAGPGQVPPIKKGSLGGKTAGKSFGYKLISRVLKENPKRICVYCHMGDATHVDHAIPKSKGGNATIDNAQLTCSHCNDSTGARDAPVSPPPGYEGPWPPPWWPPK